MPDQDAQPPRPPKRRLPILARHAISLGIVFVLALPLSYVGVRNYLQQQNLAQLDAKDDPTFELGLAYIYANVTTDDGLAKQAVQRLDDLPDERAIELHRVLLRAYADQGQEPPPPIILAGTRLMDRFEMADAVLIFRRLEAAGAGGNPEVLAALDRQLAVEDDRQFLQLVEYYDSRAAWSRDAVPADAWLRWLVLLSHSNAELTQRLIARQLGELPEQADEPQIVDALTRLSQSAYDRVRAQVLKSAAGYAAIADDPTDYEQIIFTLGQDENQTIARRAWQIVGHLNPLSGFSPNWQNAPPYVAEAILWAAVKTNPDQLGPVLQALEEETMMAPALLALSQTSDLKVDDERFLRIRPHSFHPLPDREAPSENTKLAMWRIILVFDPESLNSTYWLQAVQNPTVSQRIAWSDAPTSIHERQTKVQLIDLCLAASYRLQSIPESVREVYAQYQLELLELAAIEGSALSPLNKKKPISSVPVVWLYAVALNVLDPDILDIWFKTDTYTPFDAVDLDAENFFTISISALANLEPYTIDTLIRSPDSNHSIIAALASGLSGHSPKLISGMNAHVLESMPDATSDDFHAMTDTELAEFGLRRVDAIQALLDVAESNPDPAERYETTSLLKLALWMRGDLGDDFTPEAEAMLLDPRLPTSTVLLALLHKQRPIALEYLFGDLVEPNPDLAELFIGERFWHVFRRFVKTDDLDLWLWGDPAAQDFQIEAMRQWYWVNRYLIDDCWIGD